MTRIEHHALGLAIEVAAFRSALERGLGGFGFRPITHPDARLPSSLSISIASAPSMVWCSWSGRPPDPMALARTLAKLSAHNVTLLSIEMTGSEVRPDLSSQAVQIDPDGALRQRTSYFIDEGLDDEGAGGHLWDTLPERIHFAIESGGPDLSWEPLQFIRDPGASSLSPILSQVLEQVLAAGEARTESLAGQRFLRVPLPAGGSRLVAVSDDDLERLDSELERLGSEVRCRPT